MVARHSFIAIFSLLLTVLATWSHRVYQAQAEGVQQSLVASDQTRSVTSSERRELLETLDRIVAYEHYYRSVYGHFTQLLSRAGVSVPHSVATVFDVRVVEASIDKLLITALSEVHGNVADLISIDQNYKIQANFVLPSPRQEFLRMQAFKQLRALRDAPGPLGFDESGVFRGYFRYEVRQDSANQKTAFAVGIRPPVVGMQLEYGASQAAAFAVGGGSEDLALLSGNADEASIVEQSTGQKAEGIRMTTSEEAYLAQKIFHGEMGRYAKTWSELSRIAHFDFDGVDPLTNPEKPEKPEKQKENRSIADVSESQLQANNASHNKAPATPELEIEPVTSDE